MMKLSAALIIAAIHSTCYAAQDEPQNAPRATTSTCSIGIGRPLGSEFWDVTVYNVPQAFRQDDTIIGTQKGAEMGKGESITVAGVKITNVDNAPVFDYDVPELKAPIADSETGRTKVKLSFEVVDANQTFTTDDCWGGSVVFAAGRESWSCDFPCDAGNGGDL